MTRRGKRQGVTLIHCLELQELIGVETEGRRIGHGGWTLGLESMMGKEKRARPEKKQTRMSPTFIRLMMKAKYVLII